MGAFVETDLVICKHDQFTATRLHLFNIALDLLRLRAIRRHRNDAHLLVDLGIRFRLKSVSLRDEFLTQGLMVFDGAVKNMDDGDVARHMGMGIALRRRGVCRPARVTNASAAGHWRPRELLYSRRFSPLMRIGTT